MVLLLSILCWSVDAGYIPTYIRTYMRAWAYLSWESRDIPLLLVGVFVVESRRTVRIYVNAAKYRPKGDLQHLQHVQLQLPVADSDDVRVIKKHFELSSLSLWGREQTTIQAPSMN